MRPRGLAAFVVAGLVVCAVLALLVAPRASSAPDGLERVAEDEGFAASAEDHALGGLPTADYSIEGVDEGVGSVVAGLVGITVTFAVTAGVVALARRRRPPAPLDGG